MKLQHYIIVEAVLNTLVLLLNNIKMIYTIWKEISINPQLKTHPNTWDYYANNWEWTFIETEYNDWLWTYIWLIDNPTVPTLDMNFNIVEKTEQEINDLLLAWYWADEQSNQYVTVNNYIFTDLRPVDI